MKVKRFAIILALPCLAIAGLTACQSKEEKLKNEARAEATKFWESQVFTKCGGQYGDYFGKREGKVYQFRNPTIVTVETEPGPGDIDVGFQWFGRTIPLTSRWRTFENGAWSNWQKEEIVSPGLVIDEGRKALLIKSSNGWAFLYVDNKPTAYRPVPCQEIEALHPPT